MPKISALTELTNPEAVDKLAVVDNSATTTKYMTVGTLLKTIYPIGSVYTNASDSTNPATLFGFGAWQRIQGRVVVGVSDTDPDFAEGSIGGQKTVQAHAHEYKSLLNINDTDRGGYSSVWSIDNEQTRQTEISGSGPNNMNPYKTAYVWERTS